MSYLDALQNLGPEDRAEFLNQLSDPEQERVLRDLYNWETEWARDSQREPSGDWTTWVINAGRGFGKTRSGAEWVRKRAESGKSRRIALVGRTAADIRDVMIEGESGVLACSPPWFRPTYIPSRRRLTWPNGCRALTYTAEEPDKLRGPEFDTAWCDELASWKYPEAYTNLQLALRLGNDPRVLATTTPKPRQFFRKVLGEKGTVVTGGSTYDNRANLPEKFFRDITTQYEGTNTGRQELLAVLLDQAEGALWTRNVIDDHRIQHAPHDLERIVIGVDPAATSGETANETGIVCVGLKRYAKTSEGTPARDHYFVLEDVSGRYSPLAWAHRAIQVLGTQSADRIVAEVNNGGEMVETTLRTVDADVPYKSVHASRGKQARAEPVAALYEQGRVHHVGGFDDLEDQLCGWVPGKESPDRLDALVWAVTELKLGRGVELDLAGLAGSHFGDADHTSNWRIH